MSLHELFYAAIYSWVSLCKCLPGDHPASDYADQEDQSEDEFTVTVDSWSDYVEDFRWLARKDSDLGALLLPLDRSAAEIQPCDVKEATPLLALAAGAEGNEQAQRIYDSMMDLANYRGIHVSSAQHTYTYYTPLNILEHIHTCTCTACVHCV